jgi:hypothetical protein
MKKIGLLFLLVLCLALTSVGGYAKETKTFNHSPGLKAHATTPELGAPVEVPRVTAQAGTTYLGTWTFDSGPSCVDEGWTSADFTENTGDYWHVDNFNGLGGGALGLLTPLEGAKSMWCGARPNSASEILCGYSTLPGYGDNWSQKLCTTCLTVVGDVNLSFLASWDSEPGFDQTTVEYSACDDDWTAVATTQNAGNGGVYDGTQASILDDVVLGDTLHTGTIQIRFNFASDGGYSDQDALYASDGAFLLDSVRIADATGELDFEDFESAAVGDLGAGIWSICNEPGYGDFAAIYTGLSLLQLDPCYSDLDCMWSFFTGSTATYACGGYPATPAVPYTNSRGQEIKNSIWSPLIPWIGTGSQAHLLFNVYRDLPFDALVFYEWYVRSWTDGCPGPWRNDGFVWYGPRGIDWLPDDFSFGDKVDVGADHIQVAVGVWDVCQYVCGIWGTGDCHTNAPLFDDIRVIRINAEGPQWVGRDIDLFQDNFAEDGTATGTVRIDMAQDILPLSSANSFVPGDSAAIQVSDPENGLATDPYTGFGPAVYGYVRVDAAGPAKTGWALTDDPFRWPLVDSTTSASGDTWYMLRLDSCYTQPGRVNPAPLRYCLDLNDNLLVPGDTLHFFFGAQSANTGAWTYYFHAYNYLDNFNTVGSINEGTDFEEAAANAEEMTCLPAAGLSPGNDILYVDDATDRVVQPYFDTAFQQLGILDRVDRYDTRGSASNVSNGLASRVQNVAQQLIPFYKKIIWSSGNLDSGILGDGVNNNEKVDDYALIFSFLDQSERGPGFWLTGDYAAMEWSQLGTASPVSLRSAYMNFNLLSEDHGDVGLGVAPLVIGAAGGWFDNITGPDTLIAYGGCAGINEFDVLTPQGSAVAQAHYDGNLSYPAILTQQTTNSAGATANVMLTGFSYHYIRDDRPAGIMDRVWHLKKALAFLGNTTDEPTAVNPVARRYSLSQNYPNPFNPTTTITYTLAERADVSLRIYNVAGQLIRTLVNETGSPGEVHTATWDGRNDAGQSVSSGVYFYRLTAGSYVQTKKMVLLK